MASPARDPATAVSNQPRFSATDHTDHLLNLLEQHSQKVLQEWVRAGVQSMRLGKASVTNLDKMTPAHLYDFFQDQFERSLLTLDVLRESGDQFLALERQGHQPVLSFESELALDGRQLEQPVNYILLRIEPKSSIRDTANPIVIIDPRAGHGPGIGGFRSDSEVGVAMEAGHPVYFVAFCDRPEPGQTTTDVVMAHAAFLKYVRKQHPKSDGSVVIGNCQGGWAAALVAATHPDLVGALVLNGSPLSYWAGQDGQNPMRYLGGLLGGALPAVMSADLSDGTFDGANLVLNFEALNPANTWFRKYKDLFDRVDTEGERFKQFDRWWSGFYRMNGSEIRWILDNLFIGNKLGRGEVMLDNGLPVKLTQVDAPIFVFASWGDNITPPAQALSWVLDAYPNEAAVAKSGQRIIYTLHDSIGHLGIFVSQQIAQREHRAITSIIDYARSLPPGLYEMALEHESGSPVVRFYERNFGQIRALGSQVDDRQEFEIVKKTSELLEWFYDQGVGPLAQKLQSPSRGEFLRQTHPLRLRRAMVSSENPFMAALAPYAGEVRDRRKTIRRASDVTPLALMDKASSGLIESWLQLFTRQRDAALELAFHGIYGTLALFFPQPNAEQKVEDFAAGSGHPLPDWRLTDGRNGIRAAAVRSLLLLVKARGGMRGAHLLTFRQVLQTAPEYVGLSPLQREALVREQASVVLADHEAALDGLVNLVATPAERARAYALLEEIVGSADQLSEAPQAMMLRIAGTLGLTQPLELNR